MSFLVNIIAPKIISAIEEQILTHSPEIQDAIWNEIKLFAVHVMDKIEQKKPITPDNKTN